MGRRQIGSVLKTKEEYLRHIGSDGKKVKEFYIKITEDISLKAGDCLNLENKQVKLLSLESARDKMSAETYEKSLERINKMPDFVSFEVIRVTKD